MEPLIVDAAPKGSAILAYGTARRSRFRFVWIGGIAIAAVLALIAIAAAILLKSIPLPPHRLITIAAVPANVGKLLSTDQISDLPPSWRAAVRTGKTSPALFGIALDEAGRPLTFAFVFGSAAPSDAAQTVHRSFRTLLLDATSTAPERVSTFRFLPLFNDLRRSDASWAIGEDELRAFIGTSALDGRGGTIRGRWADGRGVLDLDAGNAAPPSDATPFVVVLGGDKNGSDLVKSAFVAQGIDIRSVSAAIAEASFSSDPAIVGATFIPPIGADDERAIRAAFGQTLPRVSTVVDATPIVELTVPTSTDASGQTSFALSDATGTPFADRTVNPCAGGTPVLRLDGPVLLNTLNAIGIPSSLSENVHSFVMARSDEGKTAICIK
jgi:hypothetical protein